MSGFISGVGRAWKLARAVEELIESQKSTREALKVIDSRLRALEDRMLGIEANERQLITEAKAASTAAASTAASTLVAGVLSETISRVTRLEMGYDSLRRATQHAPGKQIVGPGET